MAEQRRPTGQTIQVDRIISVARDRETGGAVIRLKDEDGRTIALRLWRRQLRTLAHAARDEKREFQHALRGEERRARRAAASVRTACA